MQILSAEQIRQWDEFTIRHEPIDSIDLMERAAKACLDWLETNNYLERTFHVFCGKGNNGGDGLAIARMLWHRKCKMVVHILEFGHKGTNDFQTNLARLHETGAQVLFVQSDSSFRSIPKDDVIVDALFGSGLNRPLEGITAQLVRHLNDSGAEIIAIDIPSGLFTEKSSAGNAVVHARHTLSFQSVKLAFLMPENEEMVGHLEVLQIGLHPDFLSKTSSSLFITDLAAARSLLHPRKSFANKGDYGHVLLIAGSHGKMGAALLAANACLRSGAGLLTTHIPNCGYAIMQTRLPEAMVVTDPSENWISSLGEDLAKYSVIAIGPGIGLEKQTVDAFESVLRSNRKPMVVDADGLNILAEHPNLLEELPPYSILTPHPKEFERLFGKSENDFARLDLALQKAVAHRCSIVLKGHYSFIATPERKGFFNSTGNPGMAKGGTGDSLTGMIAAFLAQKYSPEEAARLAVYLHGLAGDLAADRQSEFGLLASDLIEHIGAAVISIQD
jgi:hydroxyethylthiazole kinase-like uncharacterized protein yjeF